MSLMPNKPQGGQYKRALTEEKLPKVSDVGAVADDIFEPLLSAEEAAELLRIHPKTLQGLARAGTIPRFRMGKYWRFRKSSLDGWVKERLESGNQSRRVN